MDYATRVEHALTAAGIANVQAVIVCDEPDYSRGDVAIAFSSSVRFDPNIVPNIGSVLDKIIRTSEYTLRMRICSLNAVEPVSTFEITPYAPFGKYPIAEYKLRLDGIPEREAETQLPTALKAILELLAASSKLWDPTMRANPDCLINNHRSAELVTYEVRQTRYTPPTLVIGALTLSKAAVCVKFVSTACSCISIRD